MFVDLCILSEIFLSVLITEKCSSIKCKTSGVLTGYKKVE